ncbi:MULTISPECIES: hypothetical protein [Microbispora]|uniref:OmpR/PhoB-type domain-containing protein n=1 Tax=Microbispora hainanensis TaxID=568844 RepID=A0ABZ1SUK5_9ACTN|nr:MULTISPECIES: hypothetical protein [Microbispora]
MVRLWVLDQFRAEVGGRPVDLGPPLQRAVLARLICAGGHVVSTDRFLDDLWQGQPPPRALGALLAGQLGSPHWREEATRALDALKS